LKQNQKDCILPEGIKRTNESKVYIQDDFDCGYSDLQRKEFMEK
jgi:hypothetical protein